MKPQTLTSPSGDELVVLPRAEYEALIEAAQANDEEADDLAIYDARKADLAAGADAQGSAQMARANATAACRAHGRRSGLFERRRNEAQEGLARNADADRPCARCPGRVAARLTAGPI